MLSFSCHNPLLGALMVKRGIAVAAVIAFFLVLLSFQASAECCIYSSGECRDVLEEESCISQDGAVEGPACSDQLSCDLSCCCDPATKKGTWTTEGACTLSNKEFV